MTFANIDKKIILQEECLSPKETAKVAGNFASSLNDGDVVAFYGDLGSGKTFFIKALCRRLGALVEASSPSFTIINEYPTKKNLSIYHFDFYRLEHEAELQNIGLDDYFYSQNFCFIEWANKIIKYLPEKRWDISIEFVKQRPASRNIRVTKRE